MRAELVRVVPQPVRAAQLDVYEALARHPCLDPRQPADPQAVEAQAVLDQRALPHLDRPRRDDAEAEPRRRDRLEGAGVREEREELVRRAGQALLAPKDVIAEHCPLYGLGWRGDE